MTKMIIGALLATAAMSGVCHQAGATVLTFDDLTGTAFFTSNYNGFKFGDNSAATNPWFHTDDTQAPFYYPKSSPTYLATDFQLYDNTNAYEATQPISNTTAFIFNGAYFSGGDTIGYQLKLAGSTVYTSAPSATLTSTPMFVASGYSGLVDSVIIYGRQGFYAMDNFTFNEVTTSQAPEPAAWAMMVAGFGMIGATMRRRMRVSFA